MCRSKKEAESVHGLLVEDRLYSTNYSLLGKKICYNSQYYKVKKRNAHAYLCEYSLKKSKLKNIIFHHNYTSVHYIGYDYDRVEVILAGDKPGVNYNKLYKGKLFRK